MTQELLYTSAPQGLKPGSRGFCTVVSTRGLSAPLAAALESLSGYRPVFPLGHPHAARNPVVFSHVILSAGGQAQHVLSRIADFGIDYSRRGNKLAHHLVVAPSEQPQAGPAWLLGRPGVMEATWDGEPRLLPAGRRVPAGDVSPTVCGAWGEIAGDAGWAGVVAESFLAAPERPVQLIYSPGMDLLDLFQEVVALLPPERRWDATFTTYFTSLPPGVMCAWRGLLKDSAEAKQARRQVQALRIDLTAPLAPASGGALVRLARTGTSAPPRAVLDAARGDAPPEWFEQRAGVGSGAVPPPPPIELESAADSGVYALAAAGPPRPPSEGPPRPPRDRRRLESLYAKEGQRSSRRWRIALLTIVPTVLLAAAATGGYFMFRGVGSIGQRVADTAKTVAAHADEIQEAAKDPTRQGKNPEENLPSPRPRKQPAEDPKSGNRGTTNPSDPDHPPNSGQPAPGAVGDQGRPKPEPDETPETEQKDKEGEKEGRSKDERGDSIAGGASSTSTANPATSVDGPEESLIPVALDFEYDKSIPFDWPKATSIKLLVPVNSQVTATPERRKSEVTATMGRTSIARFTLRDNDIHIELMGKSPSARDALRWCVLRVEGQHHGETRDYLLNDIEFAIGEPGRRFKRKPSPQFSPRCAFGGFGLRLSCFRVAAAG